jgi:DNA-binding transcriptional ArsR family regulator
MNDDRAERIFSALAQATRLRIVKLLAASGTNAMTAGEISEALDVPQNTLSFHFSHLEGADLVTRERKGRYIIYGLNARKVDELIMFMAQSIRRDP